MARSKRLAFSGQHLEIERIDRNLRDVDASVNAYFTVGDGGSTVRFLGYTAAEVQAEKTALLEEFRRSALTRGLQDGTSRNFRTSGEGPRVP